MSRPPRIDFPDAVYHLTSRGNGRAEIFQSDDDRRHFLAQLAHHRHLSAVDLYAFCSRSMGATLQAARRRCRPYVQACLTEDDAPLREAMAASRYAIGGTAFLARTEEQVEQRRSGRVQDRDLDWPRRTVALDEIDAAVARHHRVDQRLFSAPGRRVGSAKAVAVELAAQLADRNGRAIGEHYGIGATAVGANRRPLSILPIPDLSCSLVVDFIKFK